MLWVGKLSLGGNLRVSLQHILPWNANFIEADIAVVALRKSTEGLGTNVANFNVGEWRVILKGADGDNEEVRAHGFGGDMEGCLD